MATFSKESCNIPLLPCDLGAVCTPQGPGTAEACIETTEAVHSERWGQQRRLASRLPEQGSHHPGQVWTSPEQGATPAQPNPAPGQARNEHPPGTASSQEQLSLRAGKERARSTTHPLRPLPDAPARACSRCQPWSAPQHRTCRTGSQPGASNRPHPCQPPAAQTSTRGKRLSPAAPRHPEMQRALHSDNRGGAF